MTLTADNCEDDKSLSDFKVLKEPLLLILYSVLEKIFDNCPHYSINRNKITATIYSAVKEEEITN